MTKQEKIIAELVEQAKEEARQRVGHSKEICKSSSKERGEEMATNQASDNRRRSPSPINGQILPDGFEKHPERRHNGAWKKEATARYKLEQMLMLSEEELTAIVKDKNAPYFERKLATCINKGDWTVLQGMMNQVYGMPKQVNENKNIEIKPILPMKEKK